MEARVFRGDSADIAAKKIIYVSKKIYMVLKRLFLYMSLQYYEIRDTPLQFIYFEI